MRITYDKSVDAAYIYLNRDVKVAVTVPIDGDYQGPKRLGGHEVHVSGINLDFGADGEFFGIEILGASHKLPKEFLDSAEQLDETSTEAILGLLGLDKK